MSHYLQSYGNYCWKWEDNYEVLAIPGGNTIAYRKYIFSNLLPHFVSTGLPPFGSLILAMIALNPNGSNDIKRLLRNIDRYILGINGYGSVNETYLENAGAFLNNLCALPEKYKSNEYKILLLHALFHDCHNRTSVKYAKKIVERASTGTILNPEVTEQPFSISAFNNDFRVLELLHFKYKSSEEIIDLLAHIHPFVPVELPVSEPDGGDQKDFVEQLIENEQTFTVGSLIKRIWSGLNIPFHLHLPSNQPLGGISDLTNKGSFDKLLISEFANDDLTFMSRIANNEALYIQREVPPQTNEKERYILIDTSIRNWGTPKTISFSLAVAIAKHPNSNLVTKLFTIGDASREAGYDTLNALIDSMSVVSPVLHAGEGLENFFENFEKSRNVEIVLITTKDAMSTPAFQTSMFNHFNQIDYWLVNDREGSVDVYKNQHQSRMHIQHFVLPLKEAWSRKRKPSNAITKEELELIRFPILFPAQNNASRKYLVGPYIFYLFNSGYLFRCGEKVTGNTRSKGWELMSTKLRGAVSEKSEIGRLKNGDFVFLSISKNSKIHCLNISRNEIISVDEMEAPYREANKITFENDSFFLHTGLTIESTEVEIDGDLKLNIKPGRKTTQGDFTNRVVTLDNITGDHVLLNLDKVMISKDKGLMLNKHKLEFNTTTKTLKLVKLKDTWAMKEIIHAVPDHANSKFVFPNGSYLRMHKRGMFMLCPAKPELIYRCVLLDSGSNKMELIKIIRSITQRELGEVRQWVYNTPSVIYTSRNEVFVNEFSQRINTDYLNIKTEITSEESFPIIYLPTVLEKPLGVACDHIFAGNPYFQREDDYQMQMVDVHSFWTQYLQPFMEDILNYSNP